MGVVREEFPEWWWARVVRDGLQEPQQQPAHHHQCRAVYTELPSGLNRPWCLLPALPCLGKSIPLGQELYRVHLEPMFSLLCSTASAMTFPLQSPRHRGGRDSAAPRAVVREILHSWAELSFTALYLCMHTHGHGSWRTLRYCLLHSRSQQMLLQGHLICLHLAAVASLLPPGPGGYLGSCSPHCPL